MAVLNWPDDFNWPYAGMPTDVPPQFGRGMIKIEDQIYWLLNAVKLLNSAAVSMQTVKDYADKGDAKTLASAKLYADDAVSHFNDALSQLENMVNALNQNIAITRNPVTGMNDYIYVTLKQMYDFLRPYPMLYSQFDEPDLIGSIWDDVDAMGQGVEPLTWFMFDKWSGVFFSGEDWYVTVTPADHIYEMTPGYFPDLFVHGSTPDELDTYGFLYSKRSE